MQILNPRQKKSPISTMESSSSSVVSMRSSSSSASGEEEEEKSELELRNWLELPRDVLSLIFIKLGAIDILLRTQSVCSLWRNLSKEPHLFRNIDMRRSIDMRRNIDMRNRWDLLDGDYDIKKIAKEAVDRSCGELTEFSMEHFGSDSLFQYIIHRSSMLKCLRLVSCYQILEDTMIEAVKKLPLLEELELCHCAFSKEVIEAIGYLCPRLKSFRLNDRGMKHPHVECDEEALAIAENMPELRHLHLFGNKLTNSGLKAILDGCLHLESLDLRQCFRVNLEGELQKRCKERVQILRLPDDSTEDYEFDAGLADYGSSDEDYSSGYSEVEVDFLSDDIYYELSEGSILSDYEDFAF